MRVRTQAVVACIVVMLGWCSIILEPAAVDAYSGQARFFASTGYSVGGAFLNFFDRHGGVRIFGYPISGEVTENGITVQYFERQRFEYHPGLAGTAHEVQLGHLGTEAARGKVSLAQVSRSATPQGSVHVPETGHSLGTPFLQFWRANGSVRVLGYPISEPVMLNGLRVQYFERALLEYHPGKVSLGHGVELAHLGRHYVLARTSVASLIAAGPKPGAPPVAVTGVSQGLMANEARIIELINGGRTSAGLAPVALDKSVTGLSRSRSADMAHRNYFSHITPDGKDFIVLLHEMKIPFLAASEVLSKNNYRENSPDRSYTGWMNSPAHRAIIMDPQFTLAGVGEAQDASGYRFYTVIFVRR